MRPPIASGPHQLLHWSLVLSPWLLLVYAMVTLRRKLNVVWSENNAYHMWYARLLGPEGLVLSFIFLGWQITLLYFLMVSLLVVWLSMQKIKWVPEKKLKQDLHPDALIAQVERSAPWVVFSLILANLIGHPYLFLPNPFLQVVVLFGFIMLMSFCYLGAVVLSITLAWSGWDIMSIMFLLAAAPILNIKQLKKMNGLQGVITIAMIVSILFMTQGLVAIDFNYIQLPSWLNFIALGVICVLYAWGLLRCGPRAFMARLFIIQFKHKH